MEYVKEVSDGLAWTCVGCDLEEGTLYMGKREGVFVWWRYQLACGHQCHERCYRRWCYGVDAVGCPVCGPLSRSTNNGYCKHCHIWGHVRGACPLFRLSFYPNRGKGEVASTNKDSGVSGDSGGSGNKK